MTEFCRTAGLRHAWRFMLIATATLLALASVPAAAADIFKGRQIYSTHCLSCHGANGAKAMPGAVNVMPGQRLMQPDTMLLGSIRSGRNAMPAYTGVLTDREILDVIAYMRTLR